MGNEGSKVATAADAQVPAIIAVSLIAVSFFAVRENPSIRFQPSGPTIPSHRS